MCTALVIRKARPAKRPPLIGPGRLPAWQASLVVLGLLAPSSRSPLYQVKGGEAVAILAPYRLVPHHSALPAVRLLTSSAAASSLTNRAGCCGTVSSACPGPYPHLLVYVAVPNAWADADRRQPLRAQWARSLVLMDTRLKEDGVAGPPPATVLHFVIGLQGLSDKDKAAVGADSTTHQDLLILPNQAFSPNQGKNYVAGQGCASGRNPTGCGCFNGDLNVPVLTQSAVSTRLVSTGSCQCTYYLPAGFAPTAGFTITVQNICS